MDTDASSSDKLNTCVLICSTISLSSFGGIPSNMALKVTYFTLVQIRNGKKRIRLTCLLTSIDKVNCIDSFIWPLTW